MGRRTTIDQRELVIHHFKNGQSQRKIAEMINLAASTVQHIIERFLRENTVKTRAEKHQITFLHRAMNDGLLEKSRKIQSYQLNNWQTRCKILLAKPVVPQQFDVSCFPMTLMVEFHLKRPS